MESDSKSTFNYHFAIGNKSGQWRYKVGDYRLIVDINDDAITILLLEIGHR